MISKLEKGRISNLKCRLAISWKNVFGSRGNRKIDLKVRFKELFDLVGFSLAHFLANFLEVLRFKFKEWHSCIDVSLQILHRTVN